MTLNTGQRAGADEVFQFLLSDEKEMNISGPGGTGKTYLMEHICKHTLQEYQDACAILGRDPVNFEIEMTATTNKAAEVLQNATGFPTSTIHSFMNLQVYDDYKSGETKIKQRKDWKVHSRKVIFIDEASMIDRNLLKFIHEGTDATCKIIYVGDHCQLAPVFEDISPIYRKQIRTVYLTEQMRNSGQPALMDLCNRLRHTVETGQFFDIEEVPGVIDFVDGPEAESYINQTFAQEQESARVLAYTNERVKAYNQHVRDLRGYPERLAPGERVINNTGIQVGKRMLRVEEEFVVLEVSDHTEVHELPENGELEFYRATIASPRLMGQPIDVKIPVDPAHVKQLVSFYKSRKDWESFYGIKNTYPDLRPRDAATAYKAQGSTYDEVFIDLENIGTCNKAAQTARMLYVACSRPRERIRFYGRLPARYRGAA